MDQELYYFTLDTPTKATAFLYGEIGWAVSAQAFVSELIRVEKMGVTEIDVRIFSYGGDVFEGFTIFTALQKSKATITTYNDSVAASIASLIFLGGKKAVMADYATLMIHNPWCTSSDEKSIEILSLVRQSIINILSSRSGLDKAQIATYMDEETWFSAEEALSLGFATDIEATEALAYGPEAGVQNMGHVKMYNRVLMKTKATLSMQNKKEAIAEETPVAPEATEATLAETTAPEPTAPATEETPAPTETEAATLELAPETIPTETPEPGTTELVTIEEVKEKIEIQNKLKDLEISNSRLREDNENAVKVNQELTAKLAAMEVTLNNYVAQETQKAETLKMTQINALIERAIDQGIINASARNSWVEVAKTSYQTAADALSNVTGARVANKAITNIQNAAPAAQEKKVGLRELEKTNPQEVERLYHHDRIAYNQLYFEAYGKQLS